MSEGKAFRRFKLLYILAHLCEKDQPKTPIPLRGLEDALVLLKHLNTKFQDFSFLLINDDWYSPEVLDDIDDLYNFGYISLQCPSGNIGVNVERDCNIFIRVDATDVINKLSSKVEIEENMRIISELKSWVINDKLHKLIVYLLETGNGNINNGVCMLDDEQSHQGILVDYSPLIQMLKEGLDEFNTSIIATQ